MITKIFISAILVLLFASCNNTRTQDKPKEDSPKALQDKNSSSEFISKRSYEDMVESLYSELVTKDIALKTLEDKIDELGSSKSDSLHLFEKFNSKNQAYFNSANGHVAVIKDSLLKNKMQNLIAKNLAKYSSSVAKHNELIELIAKKNLTIDDLHIVLKIVRTLPLIEKYQKDNLPNTKSLEGYIKQQDETIKLADTLAKK
jgi:hypothetical protein